MRLKVIVSVTVIFLILSSMAFLAIGDNGELLVLENKYIKIFINNTQDEPGRFAVDVSGGDPERRDDDAKPLIYGHPKPWTSYTTIRINGENYVFGKATVKRAGAGVLGGEILEPPKLANNQLSMKCQYGTVTAEQTLNITRSPSTGALDTASIKYVIVNQGAAPAEIGLRTVLDTMVGNNDGAPFRFGEKEITYEFSCEGNDFPDFWQAFDSLSRPSVIAQGTLKGGEVTTPDRLIFTNWGKAVDHPWDFPVEPGVEFVRLGEDELDSSVVMYWLPRTINPGQQLKVVINYGLGGITFSPGNTFMGISAPSEVQYSIDSPRKYSIVLYVEHRGEAMAKDIAVNLELPTGLECISGQSKITLSQLMPGVTKQFLWEIKPNGLFQGETSFKIKVTGNGLEENQVSRKIRIIGPPLLTANMTVPILKVNKSKWEPYPLNLKVKLKNIGEAPAYNLKSTITAESGVKLVDGERTEKFLADLNAKEETEVSWQVTPVGGNKTGKFQVQISATGAKPVIIPGVFTIPQLSTKIKFLDFQKLKVGQVICWDLFAYNLHDASKFTLNVKYNPKQLRLVYVSRGLFAVEEAKFSPWSGGNINNIEGRVNNITGSRSQPFTGDETTLARFNFIVVAPGEGSIELEDLKVADSAGQEIHQESFSTKYQIEGEPK